ncbi:MAG TPA: hypothetical protein VFY23_00060 [Candidatus Limnocylindrales bacterium]|nr:hypothetical protein [Candidatus Limnocylindrales bacterium]
MALPDFTVVAPTRAYLDYTAREREVTLAVGTRLRWMRAGGFSDLCSDLYLDWDEFELLDGDLAGSIVAVEDADTPRDLNAAHGVGPQWGHRRRLGPPGSLRPDQPIRSDTPWAASAR